MDMLTFHFVLSRSYVYIQKPNFYNHLDLVNQERFIQEQMFLVNIIFSQSFHFQEGKYKFVYI